MIYVGPFRLFDLLSHEKDKAVRAIDHAHPSLHLHAGVQDPECVHAHARANGVESKPPYVLGLKSTLK